jgi:hypothetical protein
LVLALTPPRTKTSASGLAMITTTSLEAAESGDPVATTR